MQAALPATSTPNRKHPDPAVAPAPSRSLQPAMRAGRGIGKATTANRVQCAPTSRKYHKREHAPFVRPVRCLHSGCSTWLGSNSPARNTLVTHTRNSPNCFCGMTTARARAACLDMSHLKGVQAEQTTSRVAACAVPNINRAKLQATGSRSQSRAWQQCRCRPSPPHALASRSGRRACTPLHSCQLA